MELIKRYKLDCQDQKVFLFFVTDKVRNLITSSTQQVNALTAEIKVAITFFWLEKWKMPQCTGDDTVSRALTPPNTTVSKCDVWIFLNF